jgi:hypothetical protein
MTTTSLPLYCCTCGVKQSGHIDLAEILKSQMLLLFMCVLLLSCCVARVCVCVCVCVCCGNVFSHAVCSPRLWTAECWHARVPRARMRREPHMPSSDLFISHRKRAEMLLWELFTPRLYAREKFRSHSVCLSLKSHRYPSFALVGTGLFVRLGNLKEQTSTVYRSVIRQRLPLAQTLVSNVNGCTLRC